MQGVRARQVALAAVALIAAASAGVAHSASSQSAASLVGTWARTTTCAELTTALRSAGISKLVGEMVVGNGFIPGVRSPGELRDPARPCLGAVPRKHSHFFLENGEFGSLDWNADQVDDGRYRVTRPGTVTISKEFPNVSFRFRVRGNRISFTPLVRKGCQTFRCAWAISVAYPGSTWRRVG